MSKHTYAAAELRCGSPARNLSVVFGSIAITYCIDGVNSLSLDGPTAATRPAPPAKMAWGATDISPFRSRSSRGCRLPSTRLRDLRS